jgi:hypothetical protein
MSNPSFQFRDWNFRREVLNDGRVWLEFPVIVVRGALVIRAPRTAPPYHAPTVTANEGEILFEATAPAAAPYGVRS